MEGNTNLLDFSKTDRSAAFGKNNISWTRRYSTPPTRRSVFQWDQQIWSARALRAVGAAAATSAAGGTSESTSGDGSGVGGDGDRSLRTMEVEEAEWQRRAESEAVGAARP